MIKRTDINYTGDLVKAILSNPLDFEWSLQGFGMLRIYLAPEIRLHVWDSRYQVEDVSSMHTHPWHFHSFVVAGIVKNTRYVPGDVGEPFMQQEIKCGPGGDVTDAAPELVHLQPQQVEVYEAGNIYSQLANEIHSSSPVDGTVTIIEREFLDDTEHAYVYYPEGGEWVSAEPRPATTDEIKDICANAIDRWFS